MADTYIHSNRRKRFLLWITFVFLACLLGGSLLRISYFRARCQSDTLIAKIQTPHTYQPSGSRLCVLHSITGRWGPCWELSYDPSDFGLIDLTLGVSLFGKVCASNPPDALPILRSLQKTGPEAHP